MGWMKKAPEKTEVQVVQSTHGGTFLSWPMSASVDGRELPALPLGPQHPKSRQWLMADRTVVLNLPGDPAIYPGGVIRHTFNAKSATWNSRTKTLTTIAEHPSDPDLGFAIATSGVGCACTQGAAGNSGPISDPYKLIMVNPNLPEFDWYEVYTT